MDKDYHNKIYLSRNRVKKRYHIFCYEAMKNVAEGLAEKKFGKRSFSLYAFMAIHNQLLRDGFDFRKMLNKENQ